VKNLINFLVLVSIITVNSFAQILKTETAFQHDDAISGISVNRFQIDGPVNLKYDFKKDLTNQKKVDDVLGIFVPNIIESNGFSFTPGLIKLGDWEKNDEVIVDLQIANTFKEFSISAEYGIGFRNNSAPRNFGVVRLSHPMITIEGAFMSKYGYKNIAELTEKKFYWIAVHPEKFFIAIGNEVSRNWFLVGTKNYNNFGNMTFGNIDRNNNNFWVRSQFGFGDINKNFFSQENYIVASSYLMAPPFFYIHFSPISTKGTYGFKVDVQRVGEYEKWEALFARQFGQVGQIALGWQKNNLEKSGPIIEYYNSLNINNFFQFSLELKYEEIYNRLSGYICCNYLF